MVVQAAKVHASPVARAKALPVHRATDPLHHAAMAHKAHPALKVRATAAAKVAVMAVAKAAVVAKNNVAIRVLTTVVTARVARLPATTVRAQKGVAPIRHVVVRVAIKTAATVMATSCHATSIP